MVVMQVKKYKINLQMKILKVNLISFLIKPNVVMSVNVQSLSKIGTSLSTLYNQGNFLQSLWINYWIKRTILESLHGCGMRISVLALIFLLRKQNLGVYTYSNNCLPKWFLSFFLISIWCQECVGTIFLKGWFSKDVWFSVVVIFPIFLSRATYSKAETCHPQSLTPEILNSKASKTEKF